MEYVIYRMMTDDRYQHKYRIAPARLAGYDYGSNGMYFVTICTQNRELYFGDVAITDQVASLQPSAIGQVAIDCWHTIPVFHPYVELDAFQLMPNHLHGILWICKPPQDQTDWQPAQFGPQTHNLASIIRGYKSAVKTYATTNKIDFGWQASYHDRIVRNQNEAGRIQTYIDKNPAQWATDRDNQAGLYM